MRTSILCFLLAFAIPASAQYLPLTGSKVQDLTGAPLASGQICFLPTNDNGSAIPFQVAGGGQVLPINKCTPVINGAFSITLADSVQTYPANICYDTTVVVPGYPKSSTYTLAACLQPSETITSQNSGWCTTSGCNLDNYVSTLAPNQLSTVPSLAIGTVTTLAPGAAATASIGGPNPDFLLNLGLPLPTIAAGTVTVGPDANSQSVSFVPSGNGYVLNFVLPLAPSATDTSKLPLAGGTLTGPLQLAADPASAMQPATKQYADNLAATKLPLAGGTLTGPLQLAADPASAMQPATKQYADNLAATKLPLAGGTVTGPLNVNALLSPQAVQVQAGTLSVGAAVGDGVTDDTAVLQAAINANRYLILKANATYLISAALTIPCGESTTIDFNGSTLFLKSGANDYMIKTICALGDGTSITLRNGELNGNGGAQTPNLVAPATTNYFGWAAEFYNVDHLVMKHWTIKDSNTWGIGITLCGYTEFDDFHFVSSRNIVNVGGIQGSAEQVYINGVYGYQPDDLIGISNGTNSLDGHDIGVARANNIDIDVIDIRNVVGMASTDTATLGDVPFGIGIYPTSGHSIHSLHIQNVSGVFTDHVLRIEDYWPVTGDTDTIGTVDLSGINATLGTQQISIGRAVSNSIVDVSPGGLVVARPCMTVLPYDIARFIPIYSASFRGANTTLPTYLPDSGTTGALAAVNGTWTVNTSDHYLSQTQTFSSGWLRGGAVMNAGDTAVTVQSHVYTTNPSTYAADLIFRYQDSNNFWYAQLQATELVIYEVAGGTGTLKASVNASILQASVPYDLTLTQRGSAITVTASGAAGTVTLSTNSTDLDTATDVGIAAQDPSVRVYTFVVNENL